MFLTTRLLLGGIFITMLLLSTGCSSDTRLAVYGSVSVDDSPLTTGSISLQPIEEHLSSAGGSVVNGKFELPATHGLKPGKYLVTISGYRETGKMINDYQRGKIPEKASIKFSEPMPIDVSITDSSTTLEFKLHTVK